MIEKDYQLDSSCPELDFFSKPAIRDEIIRSSVVDYYPKSSFNTNPAIFEIDTDNHEFIILQDIRVYAMVKVFQISHAGVRKIFVAGASDKCKLVNYFSGALFRSVDVYLNNVKISGSSDLYHQKAYMEMLLSYDTETKDTLGQNSLWYGLEEEDGQVSSETSQTLMKEENGFDFTSIIHCDLFHSIRYLPDKMNLSLKFYRNHENLPLIFKAPTDISLDTLKFTYDIEITDFRVKVNKAEVSQEFYSYFSRKINNDKCILPITRGVITTHLLNKGTFSTRIQNIVVGPSPRQVFVAFVKSDGFNGVCSASPYNYYHANLKSAYIHNGQEMIPNSTYQLSIEENSYSHVYQALYETLSMGYFNGGIGLTKDNFVKGSFILAFNLDPDRCNGTRRHTRRTGVIDLVLQFAKECSTNYNILCYATYDNFIYIDKNRVVTTDF